MAPRASRLILGIRGEDPRAPCAHGGRLCVTGTHRNVPTISGDTTPAVRRARYRWLSGREPADLREAWRAESLSGGWSRPRDWWTPEVDGVTEACLAQGDGCLPACERLG